MLRDFGDAREIVENGFVAVDVRAEDVPIVDGGLARVAGVAEDETTLEFGEIDAELGAALAAGRKLDGRGAAEGRRVVILRAGGDANDDGFGIAANVNPIGLTFSGSPIPAPAGASESVARVKPPWG